MSREWLSGEGSGAGDDQPGTAVPVAEPVSKTRLCPMYKVFLHNDPITTFPFVVEILRRVFNVANKQAQNISKEAHERGVAFVTALPLEQAEFRVQQAHSLARSAGYPLTFTYEPE